MATVDGLVTGIDTTAIIEGLLEIQQGQIDRLELRRQEALQKQSAVRTIEAQLTALQGLSAQLGRSVNSPLTRRLATVSDESVLIATASSSAAPGTYSLRVDALAQAQSPRARLNSASAAAPRFKSSSTPATTPSRGSPTPSMPPMAASPLPLFTTPAAERLPTGSSSRPASPGPTTPSR